MARALNRPVKTFTVIFDEGEYSEEKHAAFVAQRWGTEHHTEVVRADAIEILPSLVRHYGEPFGDKSALPMYYVCRVARQHVPMVLSGDGGDEAFAGYASYVSWLDWLEYSKPALWKRILRPLAEKGFPQRFPPRTPTVASWIGFNSILNDRRRRGLWRPEYQDTFWVSRDADDDCRWSEHYSACHRAQYLDMRYYLPFAILTKVDIASMMHGLEVRTPLVDLRVFELATRMPEAVCMKRDASGQWAGKAILKKVMEKYYPAAFLSRPKMGFDVPLRRWFSSAGQLRALIEERLLARSSMVNEYFRHAAILSLVQENSYSALWVLLFLEEWLRQNRHNCVPSE
jgi:asparagine synthase (glutamine-hydrolysing)